VPANVGNQTVTLLFFSPANTGVVNKRFQGIRPTGIYSGGYLSIVDGSHAQLSTLVCEITDGNYQVRIETALTVNIAVAFGTPYVVLRWAYVGASSDYMEILAVASPAANDLVIGKCTFSGGGALNGFVYSDRTTPNTHDLFLKVEPTAETELRVRVRAGRIHTSSGVIDVSDQKSGLFTPPASNNKIYLVYVNISTGAIEIDSSGTAAVSPTPPDYKGKLVLAEVTLASTDTNITAGKIKDVRNWIMNPVVPDEVRITKDSSGKLTTKRCFRDYILIRDVKASGAHGGTFTSGAWRTRDLTEETSDDGGHAGL